MALAWHGRHRRRQVSLCRACPFKARVLSDLALSTVVFGNCAELSLNVSRGPGFLVCWCAAQKIYDPVSLAKQIASNIGWFSLERQ